MKKPIASKRTKHRRSHARVLNRWSRHSLGVEFLEHRLLLDAGGGHTVGLDMRTEFVDTTHFDVEVSPNVYVLPSTFLSGDEITRQNDVPGDPFGVAVDFLLENAALFGTEPADVGTPLVTDAYTDAESGITYLYLRQTYQGLGVANANVNFAFALD